MPTTGGISHVSRLRSGLISLPVFAAVFGEPEGVGREVKIVGVDGRELQRLGAEDAVGAERLGLDVLNLAGATVVLGYFAAVDDVGIERVGCGVAVFFDADGMPVVEGDATVVAAAGDAGAAAVLLAAADAIGEGVVGGGVIHLRGALVIPLGPGFAAVLRDDDALIAGEGDDLCVVGIDEDVLVVVAAGSAADAEPGAAFVGGLPGDDAGHVDGVGIFGIDFGDGNVTAADAGFGARIVIGSVDPVDAFVVGAIDADGVVSGGDRGVDALRIGGRDGHLHLEDVVGETIAGEFVPGVAAVGGFVETAFGADPGAVLPWGFLTLPHAAEDDFGIFGIDLDFGCSRAVVGEEDALPGFSAIGGAVEAALFVGAVGVAGDGDEDAVGVAGIDGDLADLLAVAEAEVGPGFAAVGGFVDAVAGGEVGALQTFAAADVKGLGIAIGDGNGADGAGGLVVPDAVPGGSGVGGLPDAAVDCAKIEGCGLAGNSGEGAGSAGAHGADLTPAHVGEELGE